MTIKAYFIVPALLVLGACGHLRDVDDSDAVSTVGDDTTVLSDHSDDPTASTEPEEIILSEAETAAAEAAPLAAMDVPPIDLFERMRRDFKFPELHSKYVAEYEKWDAEHPTYLHNLFIRATPFLYHIVDEIDKRGLPMELALLPAIESAYKPEAVSPSRAGGLWQFIPSTGRQFGLRQDWWYDGRRDALASTTAALDYLTQLNEMFDGDWFLTLAAYNAGPGTVTRAIKRNKSRRRDTDYQSLRLRSETKRYVPKLMALKNIIQDPGRFNLELPQIASQPYFEVLELPGQIDLKRFAQDADIDPQLLRHLNAGFKRWATSPDGPHRILVPIGQGDSVQRAIVALEQAPNIRYQSHNIKRGETLSGISKRYGVNVSALKKANNLNSSSIRAGRDLLVPIRAIDAPSAPAAAAMPSQQVHLVKRGDTLWSIARQYKVKLGELLAWNNLSSDQILRLNQSLLIRP